MMVVQDKMLEKVYFYYLGIKNTIDISQHNKM